MKKSEFNKLLDRLEYRGSYILYDENGNPTTRVDLNENRKYSLYSLFPCHCSCIACEISRGELQALMVD